MKPLNPIIEILTKIINKIKSFFLQGFYVTAWIPYLWNDRNYDYSYIFYILYKKLSETEKCLSNSDFEQTDLDKLTELKDISLRLFEDNYNNQELERLYEFNPEILEKEFDEDSESNFLRFEPRYKHNENDMKEIKRAIEIAKEQKEKDLQDFFYIFKKYHTNWWD